MAVRTGFPLLHVFLLVGSALSRQLVTGQPGPYFEGFDEYLMSALHSLSAHHTEVEQANSVANKLADSRLGYGARLHFGVAIYSFPIHVSGSSILPDERGSSVDAHTKDGAAVLPYCSPFVGDPPERCVESGGSVMRYFMSTETKITRGIQEKAVKRAMVFWWPNTEQQWPADYVKRWATAINQGHGYLWRFNCGKYRGNNGRVATYASVLARCLYNAWVTGARVGKNAGPNVCRGLLFAPQDSISVSDVVGHLIQTPGEFKLKREGSEIMDVVKFKIVMLP